MTLKIQFFILLAFSYLLFVMLAAGPAGSAASVAKTETEATTGGQVMFVENVGQFEPQVRFQARLGRELLWLTDEGLWLTLLPGSMGQQEQGLNLSLAFPDVDGNFHLEPFGRQSTTVTFGGPDGAYRSVPAWSGVRFVDLYPGVDLEIAGNDGRWQWGLISRNERAIRPLTVQLDGAESLALDGTTVTVTSLLGAYQLPSLSVGQVTQVKESGLLLLPGSELDMGAQAGVGPEPAASTSGGSALLYSTFLGGSAWEEGRAIAVDGNGSAFATGYTESLVFPTRPGPFEPEHGIDVYLFKMNATGTDLVYLIWLYTATLNAEDYGNAVQVDDSGHAFVAGYTFSPDFCSFLGTVPGYDQEYNGAGDAFLMKVQSDGSGLVYCTYLGAEDLDLANGLVLDSDSRAYVTGSTWSTGFPTTAGAYDTSHNGLRDAYLLKLNAAGTALDYASFLGGQGQDEATDLVVSAAGQAYLTGWTTSTDFPTSPNAFDGDHNGGTWDIFVAQFAADGGSLNYSSYFGGQGEDRAAGIALDGTGFAYVTGSTGSDDLPVTPNAFDPDFGGDVCGGLPCDVFVASLNPAGTNLGYATYLGGDQEDLAGDIFVSPNGRAYVVGRTDSPGFPVTAEGQDPTHNGDIDAFVTLLESDGRSLVYGTFLGSTLLDEAMAMWVDDSGVVFITGRTQSPDFPVTAGCYDPGHNGDNDIFVSRLDLALAEPQAVFLPLVFGD